MSTKRKHEDSEPQGNVHASRQFLIPESKPAKKKVRRFEPPQLKVQAHASSVNAIKKRIRDVRRRLERSDDLPANVRDEDERALAAYEQELAAADAEKARQKIIKKYHMVRFFERQKATRQLKGLRKRLLEAKSTDEVEILKKQIHTTEVDLNYTQYCPLSEVYISLYPNKTPLEEGPKPPMWAEVEKCMEDGTLNKLRNRAPTHRISAPNPRPVQIKPAKARPEAPVVDTTGLNRRERRKLLGVYDKSKGKDKSLVFEKDRRSRALESEKGNMAVDVEDDGGESDGGFFEE